MPYQIKIGTMIYHESRYWKTENLSANEVPGWNARYLPYVVTRITEARIYATGAGANGQTSRVQLPRIKRQVHARHQTLETDGKQYHSRFHEYFYVEIPNTKPKEPRPMSDYAHSLLLLGLVPPCTTDQVNRAYKRLALKTHPDVGGKHEDFIRLQRAREIALRGY